MKPINREELRQLVTNTTIETYEGLAGRLIDMIEKVKQDKNLTQDQKNDEILLNMMGYMKACTNEIIIEVLGQILELE